jgi:hyperosmotically inducible periplasmic protein
MSTYSRRVATVSIVAGAMLLVACERTTTTVSDTAAGTTSTTTTTTLAPTAAASEAITATTEAISSAASATERAAEKAGEVLGDAAITGKVKSALIADPDVKALQIDVDTKDGVVTLNGSADTSARSERATTIARGVDGVKSVENRLAVKP